MQRGAARLQRSASSIRECDDCEHGVAIVRQHSLQCVLRRSGARPLFVSAKHEDKRTDQRTGGHLGGISAPFGCKCFAHARVCVFVQGLAILLVVPALILQFALRPYWDKRVDLLDCVCCLSILLHLEANVYFNNAEYARTAQHGLPRAM